MTQGTSVCYYCGDRNTQACIVSARVSTQRYEVFFGGAITNALKGAAPFLDTIHDKVFLRRKYLTTQGIPKIPIFTNPNTIRCKVSGLPRHYATQGIWSRLIRHKPRHPENWHPILLQHIFRPLSIGKLHKLSIPKLCKIPLCKMTNHTLKC